MNHVNPFIIDLCILVVVAGLGYMAAAIAYGIGFRDGRADGKIEGRKEAEKELAPPF